MVTCREEHALTKCNHELEQWAPSLTFDQGLKKTIIVGTIARIDMLKLPLSYI